MERIPPVYSVASFHFDASKSSHRSVEKPVGYYKNKWKLFRKEAGRKEESDETTKSTSPATDSAFPFFHISLRVTPWLTPSV